MSWRTVGRKIHHYDIPIAPESPLQVGLHVRVLALSRVAYHAPSVVSPRYDAYDPHVVGKIVAVAGCGGGSVTFELENECDLNPVKRVRLTVRMIPGSTAIPTPVGRHVERNDGRCGPPLEQDVLIKQPEAVRMCGAASCSSRGCLDNGALVKFVRTVY